MINCTRNTLLAIGVIALAGLVAAPAGAGNFSSLEERMTAQEFRDAGLDKLSDEELAALNRWIRLRSLAEGEIPAELADQARHADRERPAFDDRDDGPIETRIVGTFDGWRGETEFEMENGTVWQTTGSDRFTPGSVENPRVTLTRTITRGWQMQVEGFNRRAQVRRIE